MFVVKVNSWNNMKVQIKSITQWSGVLLLSFASCYVNANKLIKPNILFIAVDDLKPLIRDYGTAKVLTPNIDKLASQSTVFTSAYSQYPVCGPSRMSILTGLRPESNGIMNLKDKIRDVNPSVITLPQFFKNKGYETAAAGKIFDPRNTTSRSKEEVLSWSIPYQRPTHGLKGKTRLAVESIDAPDEKFVDGGILKRGKKLLKKMANKNKPFFLAVGFKKPHLPFVAPKKYYDLYNRESFDLASYQSAPEDANTTYLFHKNQELRGYKPTPIKGEEIKHYPKGKLSSAHQKELLHGYFASVSFIDSLVGELLEELEKTGKSENTIIVFWGDHGFHLGDHGLWGKHTTMEQANHVPLIIKIPGSKANRYTKPVELLDVFPSLSEAAGLSIPNNLQGKSLVSLVTGKLKSINKVAISQYKRKGAYGYSMRTEQYRYTQWVTPSGKVVYRDLYDLINDPLETKNIINTPEGKLLEVGLNKQLHTNSAGLKRLKL
ncbi:hypothetical protein CXF85_16680 [Colwellia sp. 75C3]|nr:hypothetical protein CXF85_16680 [Colwellia sp. 75C3]